MTEETIFAEALEKNTPIGRTAYLDKACAGDSVLRQRIETLLKSHDADGNFLGKPAIQCAAEELAGLASAEATQAETPVEDADPESLDFLTPSDKLGALGRLGHYEVLEVIGRGGMGIVLRAVDEKLQRVVAIKVMAAQLATNANARKRFSREAQAAAAVTHDHIVTIHAVEEGNGLPYLVMQFVSGMSLQQRLDRSGPLELREIVRIGMQTAAGLAAAHAHGLIHRDIKPANILLENGVERVKITDFGLARAVADASLTQSGVVAGTPQYMSPEQARGVAVDQRTDLFSLGSVLYAMCTGRPPFRADSNMAVLKRVCDDTPSAIRETNPEIPDWLDAIVTKLHAKNSAERFQSAVEVAELLKEHLAYLQHPSVISPVAGNLTVPSGSGNVGAGAPRRRWAMAAVMLLLCLIGGLGFTEATGVTNLRATVVRIFTPDGTLVVEVDDPDVKVTIEGDGGIVITGAGLQEVRLKPGSYKVQAAKDGKPVRLDQELVTITRGDKQVVRVRLEAEPPPTTAAGKVEPGAFVLLAAGKDRKFDTLAEAVQGASDGDIIDVRGNGPFVSEPIRIKKNALTIRAAPGFRPVIRLNTGRETGPFLLETEAPLLLEGLELQRETRDSHSPEGESWRGIIYSHHAPFYAANCRFRLKGLHTGIVAHTPIMELRNCEFLCTDGSNAFGGDCSVGQRWIIENCVQAGGGFNFSYVAADLNKVSIHVTHNTMVCDQKAISANLFTDASTLLTGGSGPPVRIEASGNVFDAMRSHMNFDQSQPNPLSGAETAAALRRLLTWQGHGNLYELDRAFLLFTVRWKNLEPAPPIKNLADWKQFWAGGEVDSLQGRIRYQGGDLLSKLAASPEKLTAEDFSLGADSAGYKAGEDGKNLGADVDLVGPGAAYERWKKTPEYQQWLKDTKQVSGQ